MKHFIKYGTETLRLNLGLATESVASHDDKADAAISSQYSIMCLV